jgi:ribosomal protein S18 acetylase RimI-like enzyme
MTVCQLTDKKEIFEFLDTDRLYAAYAIGDLEPDLFGQTLWVGANVAGQLRTLALLYKGLDPPALFLMGEATALTAILRLRMRPERVYLTCRERHLPAVHAFYSTETPIPMWRMMVNRKRFRPVQLSEMLALSPRHTDELERLYAQGGSDAFSPMQLATGVFYGVSDRGRLVAAAGVHLISPTYSLAAVGNVYTKECFRGRGYGTATTSAVVEELFRRGIRQVVLNVAQANTTAIRVYENLGFAKFCPFVEMLAIRKR